MSVFSGTADDIFQKNLVKPQSEISYKEDVTLIVEMKLASGLREVKVYGVLRIVFTNLLTLSE